MLLQMTDQGLACPRGGFWIDPWAPVPFALVTHAHADHIYPGCGRYLCAAQAQPLLERRLALSAAEAATESAAEAGPPAAGSPAPPPAASADIGSVAYGVPLTLGEVTVSFYPAGHILGSAQIRLLHGDEVCVVSGDFKRAEDPTCAPFEPIACDTFVTEASYALPLYRWDQPAVTSREVVDWWDACAAAGRAAVLHCYVLGKAERILGELARVTSRAVFVHGAIQPYVELYRAAGVALAPTVPVGDTARGRSFAGELILAPPAARGTPWMRRFGDADTAFASGAMQLRGTRRRRSYDRGFALSDHADWPGLVETIAQTGARRVLVTHGHADTLARLLREQGLEAGVLPSRFAQQPDAED